MRMLVHGSDTCTTCGVDLGSCESIWAAKGFLYCSRTCGIRDYEILNNKKDAERLFNEEAEEINPIDIGIVRRNKK